MREGAYRKEGGRHQNGKVDSLNKKGEMYNYY
jgi:hypothetical protein